MGGRTATMGQSLPAKGREDAEVDRDALALWFEGIESPATGEPPVAALPDYPSALEDRFRVAAALGRLAAMGKIHWYDAGSHPPDLRVCPSHLIVKKEKARVVHDWSIALYSLNSVLVNSPVQYGTTGNLYGR